MSPFRRKPECSAPLCEACHPVRLFMAGAGIIAVLVGLALWLVR